MSNRRDGFRDNPWIVNALFIFAFLCLNLLVVYLIYLLQPTSKEIIIVKEAPGPFQQEITYAGSLGWLIVELLSVPIILGLGAWGLTVIDQNRRSKISEEQNRKEHVQILWNRIHDLVKDFHELLLEATNHPKSNLLLIKGISSHTIREIHNIGCLEDYKDEDDLIGFANESRKRIFQILQEANLIGNIVQADSAELTNEGVFTGKSWVDICFDDADLRDAFLGNNDEHGSMEFKTARFHRGNLRRAFFKNISFVYEENKSDVFCHTTFAEAAFIGCIFRNVVFSQSDFVRANFEKSEFQEVRFENADTLHEARFQDVVFKDVTFEGFTPTLSTSFSNCKFENVKFNKSILSEFNIWDEIDLAGINLDDETFNSVPEKNQILYLMTKETLRLNSLKQEYDQNRVSSKKYNSDINSYREKFDNWIKPYRKAPLLTGIEVSVLRKSIIRNVNFIGFKISGFDFSQSKFLGCNFVDCDIGSSDFSNCTFSNCDFQDSKFNNCDFTYSDFTHLYRGEFSLSDFSHATLDDVWDCKFIDSEFKHADLNNISYVNTEFLNSNLYKSRVQIDFLPDSKFKINWYFANREILDAENLVTLTNDDWNMANVDESLQLSMDYEGSISHTKVEELLEELDDLSNIIIQNTELRSLNLSKKIFSNSSFEDTTFIGIDFSHSDFSNVNLKGAVFKDCKLSLANFSTAENLDLKNFVGSSNLNEVKT